LHLIQWKRKQKRKEKKKKKTFVAFACHIETMVISWFRQEVLSSFEGWRFGASNGGEKRKKKKNAKEKKKKRLFVDE
jgi:hypothetical protein